MEENIQELWVNYKRSSIHLMGIPEGEEEREKKKTEEIFEVITSKNFPKLMTDSKPQI